MNEVEITLEILKSAEEGGDYIVDLDQPEIDKSIYRL